MSDLTPADSTRTASTRRQWLASTATMATACLAGRIAESRQAPSVDDGFTPLFDGQTLRGWHTNREKIGHGTGGHWQIEEGVLTGEQDPPGSGNGGLLLTDRKFGDFELLIEMNPDWGPCSGVFFRCTEQGAGFQVYVDYHDRGNVGHLRGEMPGSFAIMPFKIFGKLDEQGQLTGLRTQVDPRAKDWPEGVYEYCCSPQQWLDAWRLNRWNTARIRCTGRYPQITTWINEVKMFHFNGATCSLPEYDKDRVLQLLGTSGSIGLQVHGGQGWPKGKRCRWRNIRIRTL